MQEVGTSQHILYWEYAIPRHSLEYEFDVSISMHPARASVGRLTDIIPTLRFVESRLSELANLRDASFRRQRSRLSYLEVGLTGLSPCYSTSATAMNSL
jgi:hypothetical protein